jgi:hypothetical protein
VSSGTGPRPRSTPANRRGFRNLAPNAAAAQGGLERWASDLTHVCQGAAAIPPDVSSQPGRRVFVCPLFFESTGEWAKDSISNGSREGEATRHQLDAGV